MSARTFFFVCFTNQSSSKKKKKTIERLALSRRQSHFPISLYKMEMILSDDSEPQRHKLHLLNVL